MSLQSRDHGRFSHCHGKLQQCQSKHCGAFHLFQCRSEHSAFGKHLQHSCGWGEYPSDIRAKVTDSQWQPGPQRGTDQLCHYFRSWNVKCFPGVYCRGYRHGYDGLRPTFREPNQTSSYGHERCGRYTEHHPDPVPTWGPSH